MTFAEVESGFSNLYFEGNNFENELDGEDAREDHVQVVERVCVMSALTLILQTTDHTYALFLRPYFRDYPGEPVTEEIFLWILWRKERYQIH